MSFLWTPYLDRITTRPPQGEVVNVPDMPDNACVQTKGNYSAIYWSERSEEGAMGQLLILHHGRQIEISSRVRFDSLIQGRKFPLLPLELFKITVIFQSQFPFKVVLNTLNKKSKYTLQRV